MNSVDAAAVLDFWFADGGSREVWFRKDAGFDAEVRARFGDCIEQALSGGLRDWDVQPRHALARIVVLDQFTRNAFRDTPRAFAGDALALAAARELVARGEDRQLSRHERPFAYLPFEHAEDPAAQAQSLALFAGMVQDHPDAADLLVWAKKHEAIVARFGRFPHRNAILGRTSSVEEIAFLQTPGSRF